MYWTLIATALLMGSFMAIQPAINGQLRNRVGTVAQAAMISTTVSTISLAIFVFLIAKQPWPPASDLFRGPWWLWIGGLLGAAYVAISVLLVSRLGGAVAFSLIILGQMVCALVMDHYGWFGLTVHELTPQRITGVGLVVAGVVMIRVL